MIKSCEDAVQEVKSFLESQNIETADENYFNREFNGEVDVEISLNIDISYIDHFGDCLEKLSDPESSPIEDDGYTGIEAYIPLGSDATFYTIDTYYVFNSENEKKFTELIKKECNYSQVEEIIQKMNKLESLGFEDIKLIDSDFSKDEIEKRDAQKKKEAEEDMEEHYSLDDYPMVKEE